MERVRGWPYELTKGGGGEVSQGGVGYGGAGAIGQPKARQRNRAFARSSPPIASTGY